MAAIGTALMSRVLGHSDAEKAFRPWWDTLEDFLLYGLVMLGIIIVPTAMITGTPLDCTYCLEDYCSFPNQTKIDQREVKNPGYNAWWVKKFCTLNHQAVDPFMLYFPYFLLIVAMILVAIERTFVKAFKAGSKLDKFYALLVREKVLKSAADTTLHDHGGDVVDGKEAVEIKASFRGSSGYFFSYLLRTLIELFVAAILLIYMIWQGVPILETSNTVVCNVHGFYHECSGQPAEFYFYILCITIALTLMYMLCNVYNILWLTFPCFGKLSRVMDTYRHNMRERGGNNTDKENLGELWDIYYNNRDLRLLLDLLATSSGIAPAIAIMTLFDRKFMNAMRPTIRYIAADRHKGIANVQFVEPKTGVRVALADISGVHLMYLAEIIPPADTAVEAFETVDDEEEEEAENLAKDMEMAPLAVSGHVLRASFWGLKKDQQYTMKISTVLNGRTISQISQGIEEYHEKLPVDEVAVEMAKKAQGTPSMPRMARFNGGAGDAVLA